MDAGTGMKAGFTFGNTQERSLRAELREIIESLNPQTAVEIQQVLVKVASSSSFYKDDHLREAYYTAYARFKTLVVNEALGGDLIGGSSVIKFILRPTKATNLKEAMNAFFASNFAKSPVFQYEDLDNINPVKHFQVSKHAHTRFLPEATRILRKARKVLGTIDRLLPTASAIDDGKVCTSSDLCKVIQTYLDECGLAERVDVVVDENMCSPANVMQSTSDDDKYIINVSSEPVSEHVMQGLCDHEIGTHLLRMMNDELQVWHDDRETHKLLDFHATEEGLATLNEKLSEESSSSKLLYKPALLYWAVCRAAEVGFAELFRELERYLVDPVERFKMCCRIKRGMNRSSDPGASQFPAVYFKGAVELLKHFAAKDAHEIQDTLTSLYCGRIALQDLDKVRDIHQREGIQQPKFLNSHDKVEAYMEHCRAMIEENELEVTSSDAYFPKAAAQVQGRSLSRPRKVDEESEIEATSSESYFRKLAEYQGQPHLKGRSLSRALPRKVNAVPVPAAPHKRSKSHTPRSTQQDLRARTRLPLIPVFPTSLNFHKSG